LASLVHISAITLNKRLKLKKILDKSKNDLIFAVLYFEIDYNGESKANKISPNKNGGI
jgi:hypothetical protein